MPRCRKSCDSSGGEAARHRMTESTICVTTSSIASRISAELSTTVLGSPDTRSRPRTSASPSPGTAIALPLFTFNAGVELGQVAIAAVVLGGAALHGGEGTLYKSVIGVFIMIVLGNSLNLLNVDSYWQRVAIGAVIVLLIVLYVGIRLGRRTTD